MKEPTEIKTLEEFETLLNLSFKCPVLLFKFSPVCPISYYAEGQFKSFLAKTTAEFKASTVDVIHSKAVARGIAEKIGIVHKSPQAILIKNGKAIWNESHGNLTVEEFKKHLEIINF